jgi:hypothetical protein
MTFVGPAPAGPVTADRLIAELDAEGIQRAAVCHSHTHTGARASEARMRSTI